MSAGDAALWERWRAHRDADAFAELVARHGGLVFATCRRVLGDAAEAQDAAQECFLELAQTRRLEVGASLAPWLHTVALHRSLDRIKSENRRRRREQRYAAEQPASARADLDDLLAHVDEAIAALPEDLRVPLVHRYLEGLTHDAIAARLGLAESTVRHRLDRAGESIRAFLARRGVRITGVTLAAALGGSMAQAAPASLTAVLGKVALAGGTPASWGTAAATTGGLLVMKKAVVIGVVVIAAMLAAWYAVEQRPQGPPPPVTITYVDMPAEPEALPEPPAPPAPEPGTELTPEEQAEAGAIPRGVITGRVYDAETGAGVPGVLVQATSYDPAKWELYSKAFGRPSDYKPDGWPGATTDADGHYRIVDAVAGNNAAHLKPSSLRGYSRRPRWVLNLTVKPGEETGGADFALDRGLSISGRVVDEQNRPVPKAAVWSTPTWAAPSEDTRNWDETQTDANGEFVLFGIEPNTSAALGARSDTVAIDDQVTVAVAEADVSGIVLKAQRMASIAGVAVDPRGRPLAGWHVNAYSNVGGGDGEIGPGGAFQIDGIPAGECSLAIGPAPKQPVFRAGEIELKPGQRLRGMRLTCDVGKPITGRVLDANRKPAPNTNISVSASYFHRSVQTDDKGEFAVYTGPEDDAYTLSVTTSPLGRAELKDVARGAQGVELVLQGTATVQGKVVDARTGRALIGSEIVILPFEEFQQMTYRSEQGGLLGLESLGFARNDSPDGRFHHESIPAGQSIAVVARAPGYRAGFVELPDVRAGQTCSAVIKLEPGAVIEGLVVDAQGAPVPDTYILPDSDPGPVYWKRMSIARTGRDGRFRIDTAEAGPLTLYAASEIGSGSTDIQRTPATVTIILVANGRIEGVVRAGGQPRMGAAVRIDSRGSVSTRSGQDGRYSLTRLSPGNVTVSVDLPNAGRRLTRTAVVEAGAVTTLDFDFGGAGVVEGIITLAPGLEGHVAVVLQTESAEPQTVQADAQPTTDGLVYRLDYAPAGPCTVTAGLNTPTGWRGAAPVRLDIPEGQTVRQDFAIGGGGTVEVEVLGAQPGETVAVGVLRGRVDSIDLTGVRTPEQLLTRLLDRALTGTVVPPYRLDGIEPGQHTLIVVALPSAPDTPPRHTLIPIDVKEGQPLQLSAQL